MPLSTKGRGEKNKFICITSKTTLTSSLLSLAFWGRAIWNAREGIIRKRNTVAVRYANVVLERGVSELHRKRPGENEVPVTEWSLEMNAMPTTVDPAEKGSRCVKNFINANNATKSCCTKEESQKITCVGIKYVGIVKNMLTQISTHVI